MPPDPSSRPIPSWYERLRYGMFIHWGIYSLLGRGEQVLYREHLKPSEYRKLADRFRPAKFDPDRWMAVARGAGMQYTAMTTKHHDGFAMWDTATSDFCAARTGLKRDYVAAYVKAARRAGMRVGLYFSQADWSQPAYFRGPYRDPDGFARFLEYTTAQIRELCTNYGKIDIFWFDGVWPYNAQEWNARPILDMIRKLQPGAIINDRFGLAGDIETPEQTIPEQQFKPKRAWEACMTSTLSHWGYSAGMPWKSDAQAIRDLCKIIEVGGRLIYNVGPRPDGTLPPQFVSLMKKVGAWLDANGQAIFNTTETICDTITFGLMTCSARAPWRVYLHAIYWPGRELVLAGLKNKVTAARFLATGQKLSFRQEAEHVIVTGLPRRAPDPRNTVIVLDVEGKPDSHAWARERLWTGALDPTREHAQAVAGRLAPWSQT